MCGRFHPASIEDIAPYLDGEVERRNDPPGKAYNLCPGEMVPTVRLEEGRPVYELMVWRLLPAGIRDEEKAREFQRKFTKTFNARSETITSSTLFKNPLEKGRRCLVLMNGFFEWTGPKGKKQPYYIRRRGGEPAAFAGVYTFSPYFGTNTVAVVTTMASEGLMASLHHRMPVFLEPDQFPIWLDNSGHHADEERLALLQPYPEEKLEAWPVSKAVNHGHFDGPEAIQRSGG